MTPLSVRARRIALSTLLAAVPVLATVAASGPVASAPARASALALTTPANPRPQLISGSGTLIRVSSLPDARSPLRVLENGEDITRSFRKQDDGSYLGMATNLHPGANRVTATAGSSTAELRIEDHPITGPVFSGPQQHPFFCETTAFGLAPAQQPDCSAPTEVTYQYRTTSGTFKPLADPHSRPADLATARVDGRSVPYVVRMETGTINRAVYQIAALDDGAPPSPLHRSAHWNGKLVYAFGGGCNGGFHQGNSTGGVLNDIALSQGYAVASSTLNVLDQNCSIVLSAESAMMVKEHFINAYGPVTYTIGWGASGGGIQQYDIADAYPGILDGIVPGVPFTDPLATMGQVADCRLLNTYFSGPGSSFTAAQRQAVAGYVNYDTCTSWDKFFANRLTPTDSCNKDLASQDDAIPASAIWNATTNPHGVICSLQQQLGNQIGIDRRTGFAPMLYDNVGVQYGLGALDSGAIGPDQFIALNRDTGGYDQLGRVAAERTSAKKEAIADTYREGLVPSGAQGLRAIPIIDQRTYLDQAGPLSDIHTAQWSFAMRARLLKANGTAANQVIIENSADPAQQNAASAYELRAMDAWLANIAVDESNRSAQQKVAADKPAGLGDGCYLPDGRRILAPLTAPASGPCATQYPIGSDPRAVAGAPAASDVLKCRLRPVDFSDYRVHFTESQQRALKAVFPQGVCDYRVPGQGQTAPMGTWLTYGDGSHGTFGHAPQPHPLDGPPVLQHGTSPAP
ncbi:DUF6351 family protein [Streptomyces sp. NPDC048297]|uniref:DUF6351 family protein n=1 Tax=Streptomyces sp. NPDC048297 TaxID=3365531 RepID=UPI00371F80CD